MHLVVYLESLGVQKSRIYSIGLCWIDKPPLVDTFSLPTGHILTLVHVPSASSFDMLGNTLVSVRALDLNVLIFPFIGRAIVLIVPGALRRGHMGDVLGQSEGSKGHSLGVFWDI